VDLFVKRVNGRAMAAKPLICLRKKPHAPKKRHTSLTERVSCKSRKCYTNVLEATTNVCNVCLPKIKESMRFIALWKVEGAVDRPKGSLKLQESLTIRKCSLLPITWMYRYCPVSCSTIKHGKPTTPRDSPRLPESKEGDSYQE